MKTGTTACTDISGSSISSGGNWNEVKWKSEAKVSAAAAAVAADHWPLSRETGNNVRWIHWSVVITATKALVFALVYVCLFNDHWFPAYWLLSAFFLCEFIQQAAGTWVSLHEMIAKPPPVRQKKIVCFLLLRFFGIFGLTIIVFKSKKYLLSVLVVRADTSSNVSLAKWAIIFRLSHFHSPSFPKAILQQI